MQVISAVKQEKDFIPMNKQFFVITLCISLIVVLSNCKKSNVDNQVDFFPPVQVYTQLNLSLPQYVALTFPQGYVYLPEGNKGIVVFNKPSGGYVAFDRTCSHNPNDACAQVTVDSNFVGLRCGKYVVGANPNFETCCASIFDLSTGVVIQKPAVRPLKQYFTSYNATTNVLFVSSSPL
jgi:Rieske Fe-S protein